MTTRFRHAENFAQLHSAPEILRLVNVWDVVSAKAIADLPETGHRDGRPLHRRDVRLQGRREHPARGHARHGAAASSRPSTCPSPPTSTPDTATRARPSRKPIGVGVVGANIEDRLKPLAESVAVVEASSPQARPRESPSCSMRARMLSSERRPPRGRVDRRCDRARPRLSRAGRHHGVRPGRPERRRHATARRGHRRPQGQRDRPARSADGGRVRGAGHGANLVRPDDPAGRADRAAGRREVDLYADGVIPSTIRALN